MADINLSLGLELDTAKLADIQKRLDGLKADINIGGSGSSGGGGGIRQATKEIDEFNEALANIRSQARMFETTFRIMALETRDVAKAVQLGKASVADLKLAQEAETKAKEDAIRVIDEQRVALNNLVSTTNLTATQFDKITIAEKSLVEGGQRVKVGFVGMATALDDLNTSQKTANNLLLEVGRGFSDAGMFAVDFRMGLLAVSNNISQVADVTGRMVTQSIAQAQAMRAAGQSANAFAIAMKGLWSSMMGVGGIILAFNVALTALQFWSQKTEKAKDDTTAFSDALQRLRSELDRKSVV